MSEAEPIITLRDVRHYEGARPTLDGISLQLAARRKLAIAGETGSGKTTLLLLMAGLARADEGSIHFEGKRVKGPDERLIPGEPGVAYLSQQYEFPNQYRMEEILRFENKLPPSEEEEIYRLCHIDHLLERTTVQLSGGERQRMALARLLVRAPRLLLLDEPFSNLDAVHKVLLQSVINSLSERLGITVVLVAHDAPDLLSWADELAVLRAGRLVQQGRPEEVYSRPVDVYTATLLGQGNLLSPGEAAAFTGSAAMRVPVFIRTEDFFLSEVGVSGIIQSYAYFGSYYEARIVLDDGPTITARTASRDIPPGRRVRVGVKKEKIVLLSGSA